MNDQITYYPSRGTKLGEIVDRQHEQIKRAHRELHTSIVEGAGWERILQCSRDLIITTLLHFESEEQAMGENPSRSLEAHRRLHAEMIESLKDISADLERRKISGAMTLLKFFEGRLTFHLDTEDAALERELSN
jgi:hemerythrin-like metal-binding protein